MSTLTTQARTCGAMNNRIFEIRAGLPSRDVLEKVQCYLCAALDIVREEASSGGADSAPWAAAYLIDISHAAIEAVLAGMPPDSLPQSTLENQS